MMKVKEIKKIGIESVTVELTRVEVAVLVALLGDADKPTCIARLKDSDMPAGLRDEAIKATETSGFHDPAYAVYSPLHDLAYSEK